MKIINFCNQTIIWSFYLLFFSVPLVFTSDTSELFEFNKMWLTLGITAIIAGAWFSKMIIQKQMRIQRTPLDIPLVLFLLSQIISTFKSLDSYVSWWGYYSRFNGGLLSTLTYIFLYYALVTNLTKKHVINILKASIISGLIVSLWGLPSHFGYDPTCFLFRGTLDVSCWTSAFQPKARIFSTMGQPDWLAAYLSILIPIVLVFCLDAIKKRKLFTSLWYFFLTILFYVDFLYTRSKGSFIGLIIPLILIIPGYFWITKESISKAKAIALLCLTIVIFTFFLNTPFDQLNKYTFDSIKSSLFHPKTTSSAPVKSSVPAAQRNAITGEIGGTDSGKIRLFVWKGAIDAWLHNIPFGTGVETFAFAYYLYRPVGHNLTSEWDYLYNKAHNEYLNYLATTGIFGLVTYLAFIVLFLVIILKTLWQRANIHFDKKQQSQEVIFTFYSLISLGLAISFLTIIISNFFGFSVVIINIYLFLLPAFFFLLLDYVSPDNVLILPPNATTLARNETNVGQWLGVSVIWLLVIYWLAVLLNYWNADKAYALGYNLDRVEQYQAAYADLHQAAAARPDEPVFKDELSANDAILAVNFASQKDTTNASRVAQEAIQTSNDVTTNHPNNVTYWKTRVRVMYTLAEISPQYLSFALSAIQKAHTLAPTDAKIAYNLGLLYSQNNQLNNAVKILQQTIAMKPDYRDAYYALGVLLHQQAINKDNKIVNPEKEKEAVTTMKFILDKLSPGEKQTHDMLQSWGEIAQ